MHNTRELRAWVYSVLVSIGPLVSFYGLATDNEIALWLGLGGTLLGVPSGTTALANLTPKPDAKVAASATRLSDDEVDMIVAEMHAEGEIEEPVPDEVTDEELAGVDSAAESLTPRHTA